MHLALTIMQALGLRESDPDALMERELARDRLRAQERRVHALDRAVEVIQRKLTEGPSRDQS